MQLLVFYKYQFLLSVRVRGYMTLFYLINESPWEHLFSSTPESWTEAQSPGFHTSLKATNGRIMSLFCPSWAECMLSAWIPLISWLAAVSLIYVNLPILLETGWSALHYGVGMSLWRVAGGSDGPRGLCGFRLMSGRFMGVGFVRQIDWHEQGTEN